MSEKEHANNCIKEILESYLEFIDIALTKDENFIKIIAKNRKKDWTEFYNDLNKGKEKQN